MKQLYSRKTMKQKEVDDVLGGEGAWDNVDQTSAQCPNRDCEGEDRAYFFQLQIRSADEPVRLVSLLKLLAAYMLDDNLLQMCFMLSSVEGKLGYGAESHLETVIASYQSGQVQRTVFQLKRVD